MIGGVIVAIDWLPDRIRIAAREKSDSAAVEIHPTNYALGVGDVVWWQGDHVFWTKRGGRRGDVKLHRLRVMWDGSIKQPECL